MLLSNILYYLLIKAGLFNCRHPESNIGASTEVAEAGYRDAFGAAETNKFLLSEIRVQLNLKHRRLNLCIVKNITEQ